MMLKYTSIAKERGRKLRTNMTDAEKKLWPYLRRGNVNGLKFYRQKPIGKYIVDFYCPKLKLVIEIDGDQHYYEEGVSYDKNRDDYLKGLGLNVIRVSNIEVMKNVSGIVQGIWNLIVRE